MPVVGDENEKLFDEIATAVVKLLAVGNETEVLKKRFRR